MDPISAYKKYSICSDHFLTNMFTNSKKKRLMHDAVPVIIGHNSFSNEIMEEYEVLLEYWKGEEYFLFEVYFRTYIFMTFFFF
jgi:hypothetical protein